MATAIIAAPSASVSATCVRSRKKTRAVTAKTPKQTVKTVFSVTCEAERAGPEVVMVIAPLYRSFGDTLRNSCQP